MHWEPLSQVTVCTCVGAGVGAVVTCVAGTTGATVTTGRTTITFDEDVGVACGTVMVVAAAAPQQSRTVQMIAKTARERD